MAGANTVAMAPRAGTRGGTADATTETVFTKLSATTAACLVYIPESGKLDGRNFRVHAHGHMTGGGTTNWTGALYFGTSTTVGSDTKIATTAGTAVNSSSGSWKLEADLTWDSVSKIIQGRQQGHDNNTAVAVAAVSNTVTAQDPSLANTSLGFLVSSTFSASFAGNVCTLDELSISIVD